MSKIIKNDFKIVCFGGGVFSKKELKIFRELNILDKNFIFRVMIIYLHIYIQKQDYLFFLTIWGFGIPILEAMLIGCLFWPVKLKYSKNLQRWWCYFNNNDQNDLSEKLEKILYSNEYLLSNNNLALEIPKDTAGENANETYNIYKKNLNK